MIILGTESYLVKQRQARAPIQFQLVLRHIGCFPPQSGGIPVGEYRIFCRGGRSRESSNLIGRAGGEADSATVHLPAMV